MPRSLETMKQGVGWFSLWKVQLWIALFIGLSISNILQSGYYGDDLFNSCIQGLTMISHRSVADVTWEQITAWVEKGRVFPFALYFYFLFYWVQSLVGYKFFILVCTVLSILFFGYFIQRWTQSNLLSIFSMILLPIFFQYRIYHDPILSFNGFMQIVLMILISSLLAFMRYEERHSKGMYLLSMVLFLIGLLTYDLFYVFFPLYFIVSLKYQARILPAFQQTLPFLAIESMLLIVVLIVRQAASNMYAGTIINLNFVAIFKAFCMELVGAFPLSYWLGNPSKLQFGNPFRTLFAQPELLYTHLLLLVILYFLYQAARHQEEKIARQGKQLLLFGLALWIFPAAILSLAIKYQKGLRWGLGHIPVYVQYFGLTCVAVYFVSKIVNLASSCARSLWAIFLFLLFYAVLIVNIHCNQKVIEDRNPILKYPRLIAEKALRKGILDHAKDNRVLSYNNYSTLWESYLDNQKSFFSQYARRVIHSILFPSLKKEWEGKTGFVSYKPQDLYIFSYWGDQHMGFAKSGKVELLYLDLRTDTILKAIVSDVNVYAWADDKTFLNKVTYQTLGQKTKEIEFSYSKRKKEALISLQEPEKIEFLSVGLTGGTLPYEKRNLHEDNFK